MTENEVAREVVDTALHIHRGLGPGLFESVYKGVLASQLEKRGLVIATEQIVPVEFEGIRYEMGFRADLIVEDKVIVEVKSVSEVLVVHKKRLLTYLKLSRKTLGLLINFNVPVIKDGITRVVNGLEE